MDVKYITRVQIYKILGYGIFQYKINDTSIRYVTIYLWIEWIYLDIFLIFSKYLSLIVNALSFDHTYTKNYQVPISIFFFWILTKLKCLKGSKTRWISCKVIDNKSRCPLLVQTCIHSDATFFFYCFNFLPLR